MADNSDFFAAFENEVAARDPVTAQLIAMAGVVTVRTEIRCDLYRVLLSVRFGLAIDPFLKPEERLTLDTTFGKIEVDKFMCAIAPVYADFVKIRCASMREYRPPTAAEWRRLDELGVEYDVAAAVLERAVAKIN